MCSRVIRLTHPALQEGWARLVPLADAQGIDLFLVCTYRSRAEQAQLYAQGRTRAGQIVTNAGLANDASARWAMVDSLSYASTAQPDIHILGDSQATGQPKSGHMANSQAKVCADAIIRSFNGEAPDPSPVTSSAYFSPIISSKAAWLTASFQYADSFSWKSANACMNPRLSMRRYCRACARCRCRR